MKRRTKENKEDDTMAKTILVVEDDQNISELLRLYLEKEGYTVNIADDGGKGVELYRRRPRCLRYSPPFPDRAARARKYSDRPPPQEWFLPWRRPPCLLLLFYK